MSHGQQGNSHGGEIVAPGMKEAHAHHGHIIVPKRTLVAVLVILMTFTALTVFAANAEAFIAHAFRVELPQWMNVAVALSIAVVKSVIVAMYFMQLRYDNPMNSAIAIFTIMILACFLGFTMIDLGMRGTLDSFKAQHIQRGGTGGVTRTESWSFDEQGNFDPSAPVAVNVAGPIAQFSKDRALQQIAQLEKANIDRAQWPKRLRRWAEHLEHDAHADGHGTHASTSSNANQSRPRVGITLPELLEGGKPAAGGH